MSRAAGWNSPVVLHGGRIVGVWSYTVGKLLEIDVELLGADPGDIKPAMRRAAARLAKFFDAETHLTLR